MDIKNRQKRQRVKSKNTNSIERSWSKKHIDNYFSKKAANPEITE